MNSDALSQSQSRSTAASVVTPLFIIGVLIGVIMPIISAILYPTYTHVMNSPGLEWSRLIEAPFALCEAAIVGWALFRGFEPSRLLKSAPTDVKIALLLLFAGIFLSSALLSQRPSDSLTMTFISMIHILFFAAVAHLVSDATAYDHRKFIWLLGAGLPVLALWTAIRFLLPPDPSEVMGGVIVWKAATPGFINVRYFGSWTGGVCAAFLIILLSNEKHRSFTWSHLFFFFAAAMTIWSGTRAAIIALGVTLIILVATNKKLPDLRSLSIVAMLTGGALVAAWPLIPYDEPSFQLFARSGIGSPDEDSSGRLALWKATFDRWQDSPWLGWGSGSTFWEVFVDWTHTQPHNVILQFLISWGIVGASGALWLLGRAIHVAHKKVLCFPHLQPMLAVLYSLLIMSLVAGMLHYPRFIMLIMALFAIIISYKGQASDETAVR